MRTLTKHWRDDLIRPAVRSTTNRLLEMAEESLISYRALAEMALNYMSEDDVADMARANDLLEDEEDD